MLGTGAAEWAMVMVGVMSGVWGLFGLVESNLLFKFIGGEVCPGRYTRTGVLPSLRKWSRVTGWLARGLWQSSDNDP